MSDEFNVSKGRQKIPSRYCAWRRAGRGCQSCRSSLLTANTHGVIEEWMAVEVKFVLGAKQIGGKKVSWITASKFADIRAFQIDVLLFIKGVATKRRFSALPGTCNHDYGILCSLFL